MTLRDKINSTMIYSSIYLAFATLSILPQLIYEKATTQYEKEYTVRIDSVHTARTGNIYSHYYQVSGDTVGKLYTVFDSEKGDFEEGKEYRLNFKKYGLLGEQKIKKLEEIVK
ncbi:MAG: hypothetical protein ACP5N2_00555 [Candidatus Nanoarchaeia archaeon]